MKGAVLDLRERSTERREVPTSSKSPKVFKTKVLSPDFGLADLGLEKQKARPYGRALSILLYQIRGGFPQPGEQKFLRFEESSWHSSQSRVEFAQDSVHIRTLFICDT